MFYVFYSLFRVWSGYIDDSETIFVYNSDMFYVFGTCFMCFIHYSEFGQATLMPVRLYLKPAMYEFLDRICFMCFILNVWNATLSLYIKPVMYEFYHRVSLCFFRAKFYFRWLSYNRFQVELSVEDIQRQQTVSRVWDMFYVTQLTDMHYSI